MRSEIERAVDRLLGEQGRDYICEDIPPGKPGGPRLGLHSPSRENWWIFPDGTCESLGYGGGVHPDYVMIHPEKFGFSEEMVKQIKVAESGWWVNMQALLHGAIRVETSRLGNAYVEIGPTGRIKHLCDFLIEQGLEGKVVVDFMTGALPTEETPIRNEEYASVADFLAKYESVGPRDEPTLVDGVVSRLLGEQAPDAPAAHSGCQFYSAIKGREGTGRCSQFNKEVPAKGPVCGDFEARADESTKKGLWGGFLAWLRMRGLLAQFLDGRLWTNNEIDTYVDSANLSKDEAQWLRVRARKAFDELAKRLAREQPTTCASYCETSAEAGGPPDDEVEELSTISPAARLRERRMAFRTAQDFEDHLRQQYGEDPLLYDTAVAFADRLDRRWGRDYRQLDWKGEWAGPNEFIEQAEVVGDYNGFGPDTAVDLTDAFGPEARYRLAREASVAVTVEADEETVERANPQAGDFNCTRVDIETAGGLNNVHFWWD